MLQGYGSQVSELQVNAELAAYWQQQEEEAEATQRELDAAQSIFKADDWGTAQVKSDPTADIYVPF